MKLTMLQSKVIHRYFIAGSDETAMNKRYYSEKWVTLDVQSVVVWCVLGAYITHIRVTPMF